MTQRDNILQELNELKSTLATLNLQNPYLVPAGYFDGLIAQVLNRIKALEATHPAEDPIAIGLSHSSPVLSKLSKQTPYIVPEGYFEGLAEKVLLLINTQNNNLSAKEEIETLSPLLSGLNKEMPFAVPSGYFEGLAANIIQTAQSNNDKLTAQEELASLSPLLSGLSKKIPFTVPQGYFESLAENNNREESKPATKVIAITSRKWFRYAAAAVVVGIVAMAGFLFLGTGEKEPGGKALAKFTRDVKKMDETQKKDLMDFIDMNSTETAQIDIDNKTKEVKNLLKGISEEELKDFEEQTEDIEDVLMTN